MYYPFKRENELLGRLSSLELGRALLFLHIYLLDVCAIFKFQEEEMWLYNIKSVTFITACFYSAKG